MPCYALAPKPKTTPGRCPPERDAVLKGADPIAVHNQNSDPLYRVGRVGDVVASTDKIGGMRSEELALHADDMHSPSLSPAGRIARDYVVENGKRTGHEYGAAVMGSEVIGRFTSNKESALIVPRYIEHKNGSVEIHHNHPSGDSLSAKDFAVLLIRPELGAVAVHGHSGFYARAVRFAQPIYSADDALLVANSMSSAARSLTQKAFADGTLTSKQAQSGLWQVVMGLLFEDDGRILYNMNSQSLRDLARMVIDNGK